MRVDILMATYNGAKYIRQQILSIIAQTHSDWRLFVHDDGSTDQTAAIVREFAEADERIFLCDDGITKLGPNGNFMHLLPYVDSEFACFCDQDDVWFDTKLETLLIAIQAKDNSKPQVVYSNGYDWYPHHGNYIGRASTPFYCYKMKDALFINGGIQGCASIFNKEMKRLIDRKHRFVAMHDQLLMLVGIITKGIDYVDQPLFLYRQHEVNFTSHQAQNLVEKVKVTLRNHQIPVVSSHYYKGISSVYEAYAELMTPSDRRLFEVYLDMPNRNLAQRLYQVVKCGFTLNLSTSLLLLKLGMRRYSEEA